MGSYTIPKVDILHDFIKIFKTDTGAPLGIAVYDYAIVSEESCANK